MTHIYTEDQLRRAPALSILQPWAWCIIRPDLLTAEDRESARVLEYIKDIENRTWRSSITGPVLIHTGRGFDDRGYEWLLDLTISVPVALQIPAKDEFQRGGIIGYATISPSVKRSDSPWFTGPFGFPLSNQTPIPFIPCPGQLGFFKHGQEIKL